MKSRYPVVSLKGYVKQISSRNRNKVVIEVYSVTNSEGFTKSTDYFSKEVFSKDISNYKVVSVGQFAYNPSRINVGSIDYLKTVDRVLVSPLYIVFKTDQEIYPEYLLRYLKSDWGNLQIRANTEGAVRDSLKFKGLERIKVPLPSIDDQIRIAHLLSKVEGLIAQRKQYLQQLDNLLKSVFLEMFGDPVRNEKGWDTVPFHKIGQFISGGTPSKSKTEFWEGSFPWVSPKDMKVSKIEDAEDHISESVFEETTLKRIKPNHLLIVVRGMILAHSFPVAINTVEIAINQDMKAIKPINGLNVVYLQHCLSSLKRKILKLISTAGHGTRRFDSVAMQKLFIPNPPPELQCQFAAVAEKVENIKYRYQQSLVYLEKLYGALSQKAFKGELDLSRVVLLKTQGKITEEQQTVSSVVVELPPTIELPAPDDPKSLLSAEGRKAVIEQWLNSYLGQLGSEVFSSETFMKASQQRLWELLEDGDPELPELGVAEYDQLKAWIFQALEGGHLAQSYDDAENRVQVSSAAG